MGLGCLLGGGLATLTELLLGLHPWGLVANGVAAFNGVLVGTVIPILFPVFYGPAHNVPHMWAAVAIGAVTSVFLASAFNNFLAKFNVPYMALPFNLIATVVFLTLQPASREHMVGIDNTTVVKVVEEAVSNVTMEHSHHGDLGLVGEEEELDWLLVARGVIVSMGQVDCTREYTTDEF